MGAGACGALHPLPHQLSPSSWRVACASAQHTPCPAASIRMLPSVCFHSQFAHASCAHQAESPLPLTCRSTSRLSPSGTPSGSPHASRHRSSLTVPTAPAAQAAAGSISSPRPPSTTLHRSSLSNSPAARYALRFVRITASRRRRRRRWRRPRRRRRRRRRRTRRGRRRRRRSWRMRCAIPSDPCIPHACIPHSDTLLPIPTFALTHGDVVTRGRCGTR